MFKKARQKGFISWARLKNMELMKICLEGFKRTGDEMYWENAKIFGEWSKTFKKDLES